MDRSQRSKGKAFVEYASSAEAVKAIEMANCSVLDGRELKVEFQGASMPAPREDRF
jgi:RNA recognition motif-containing protein